MDRVTHAKTSQVISHISHVLYNLFLTFKVVILFALKRSNGTITRLGRIVVREV